MLMKILCVEKIIIEKIIFYVYFFVRISGITSDNSPAFYAIDQPAIRMENAAGPLEYLP